jgi:hypothetical protein
MSTQILDGTGNGYKVMIDSKKRIHAFSVSTDIQGQSAVEGNTYNINTGTVSLSSANESGLLYFKNNGETDLHISSIGYLIGNSTGGTGDIIAKVLRNPDGGTVVSDETLVDVNINKNFGSSESLTVSAYKGGEGKTLTGGEEAYYSLVPKDATQYVIATGTLVIPKGKSLGVSITPQSGNTSMDVQVFLAVINYKL